MKIGLAIALGNAANQHTRTFTEAVNYSLQHFPQFKNCTLKVVNDEKSESGGLKAAEELIKWGADAVVGHFSSIAALAALPAYLAKNIPVMLPAATSCRLDEFNEFQGHLYRYQINNESLIAFCVKKSIENDTAGDTWTIVQNNDYGDAMLNYLPLLSNLKISRQIPTNIRKCDRFIVIGYSDFAAKVVKNLTQSQINQLILVDDSDNPDVWSECIIKPEKETRIRSSSWLYQHGNKNSYWNESLLSLSLAVSLIHNNSEERKQTSSFKTYLGIQEFDKHNCYSDCLLTAEEIR